MTGVLSDIVLTARNLKALEDTKAFITSQAPGVKVHVVPGDLSDMESLPEFCTRLLESFDPSRHQQGVLVNNAGTMNEFISFLQQTDPKKTQSFFDTNLTSMCVLTTRFFSAMPNGKQHYVYVVNITGTLSPGFRKWYSLYAAAKAGRTAFMECVLEELPEVRQLNYSPGPCDTDMLRQIPSGLYSVEDQSIRLLTAEESIGKMVKTLKEDKYENGCTVDYFDRK